MEWIWVAEEVVVVMSLVRRRLLQAHTPSLSAQVGLEPLVDRVVDKIPIISSASVRILEEILVSRVPYLELPWVEAVVALLIMDTRPTTGMVVMVVLVVGLQVIAMVTQVVTDRLPSPAA